MYADQNGGISQTQYYTGVEEIATVYDSSGSEYEELLKNGTEKLNKDKSAMSYDMTMTKIEGVIDIGDIVGGQELSNRDSNDQAY